MVDPVEDRRGGSPPGKALESTDEASAGPLAPAHGEVGELLVRDPLQSVAGLEVSDDEYLVAPTPQASGELPLAASRPTDGGPRQEEQPHPRQCTGEVTWLITIGPGLASVPVVADPSEEGPPRRLFGLLCTFRRADEALRFVAVLEAQTRPPDVLLVIDNGADDPLRDGLAGHRASSLAVRYLRTPSNIGPAGALHLGLRSIRDELAPDDLVLHLDDDDPPVRPDQLEQLVASFDRGAAANARLAGVGLSGGRLQPRTGFIEPVSGSPDLEPVDHLHGGYLPLYRGVALLAVDGNDPTFFYGFEELELGRRLRAAGWQLLVDNALMRAVADRYPKRGGSDRDRRRIDPADLGWSRFHKERNLIRILRRERRWGGIIVTVLLRHLVRPLSAIPRQPGVAWRRLRLGVQATAAGLRDATGIDSRYPVPDA